jgi:hypothetical protein
MTAIKIVVWDNIGNVLLGVRPWEEWSPRILERLRREQPEAVARAPSFAEIFRDYEIELTWLYDPVKSQLGFRELFATNGAILRDATEPATVAATIHEAEILILHKETVAPDVLRAATGLRLIQHLGQDIRGVPLDVAREMGVPIAAVPLTNYLVVAEQAWAMILGQLKRLPQQRAQMAARAYTNSWGYAPGLRYVADLSLGLLGLGEIARPLARYARAFDMRVRYWDRVRSDTIPVADAHVECAGVAGEWASDLAETQQPEREIGDVAQSRRVAPAVGVGARGHLRALLRQPLQLPEDHRPGLFRDDEVVGQRHGGDRHAHLARHVERHAANILPEMLDQAQTRRGAQDIRRDRLLVQDQDLRLVDRRGHRRRLGRVAQDRPVRREEFAEAELRIDRIIEPGELDLVVAKNLGEARRARHRLGLLPTQPLQDARRPLLPRAHPEQHIPDVVPDHDLDRRHCPLPLWYES